MGYFMKNCFLNAPEVRQKLRNEIFAPGMSRDENESLRQFLGRNWTADAYAEEILSDY